MNTFLILLTLIGVGVQSTGFDESALASELQPLTHQLSQVTGFSEKTVLYRTFGELYFQWVPTNSGSTYSCWSSLRCYGGVNPLDDPRAKGLLIHELGHRFLNDLELTYDELQMDLGYWQNDTYVHITGVNPTTGRFERTANGYLGSGQPYEQHGSLSPNYNTYKEAFADMFMNWALQQFADNEAGRIRARYMNDFISRHTPRKPQTLRVIRFTK